MMYLNYNRWSRLAVKAQFNFLYTFYRNSSSKLGPVRIDVRRLNRYSGKNIRSCSVN